MPVSHSHAQQVSSIRTIAVICDPEASTAEVARHLHRVLPVRLAELCEKGQTFDVCVHHERLPIGKQGDQQTLIDHAVRMKRERSWEAAVCVTDLPLCGENDELLVADLSVESGVAVLSLPALGAGRLRRRVTEVTVQILQELIPTDHATPPLADRDLPGPFRLVTPETDGIDAQVVASRGLYRQLVGMVRANRPWRLWMGLRRGVVAALAFSILMLINPTVWELGIQQSSYRLVVISLCVVVAMVTWLIFYHHLWVFADEPGDRRQVFLFNASTAITFTFGLTVAFIALLAVNFAASRVLLSDNVLANELGSPPGVIDYVKVSWMATACASVIGALGTGFENGEDVRDAAYSEREAERGKQRQADTAQ